MLGRRNGTYDFFLDKPLEMAADSLTKIQQIASIVPAPCELYNQRKHKGPDATFCVTLRKEQKRETLFVCCRVYSACGTTGGSAENG